MMLEIIVFNIIILWGVLRALNEHVIYDNSWLRTNQDFQSGRGVELVLFFLALAADKVEPSFLIGSLLISYFIYEVLLSRLFYTKWFPKRQDYGMMHMFVTKRWIYDTIILCIGVILCLF